MLSLQFPLHKLLQFLPNVPLSQSGIQKKKIHQDTRTTKQQLQVKSFYVLNRFRENSVQYLFLKTSPIGENTSRLKLTNVLLVLKLHNKFQINSPHCNKQKLKTVFVDIKICQMKFWLIVCNALYYLKWLKKEYKFMSNMNYIFYVGNSKSGFIINYLNCQQNCGFQNSILQNFAGESFIWGSNRCTFPWLSTCTKICWLFTLYRNMFSYHKK